ncbi:hypothetical protein SAMN05421749_101288 [Acinetobacter marinus]|uniref:Alpha/beta hydrolase n=1 Tax=Acinetobacter marinus TaxID=281375 RepID=A0A1G6GQR5_9GAMM|nr:alpha/beta hydrolase [Acinetobacter marinus]SDB84291.1 hypothetical protein SAMN05421749_101288 [Acinetobacter marinus]
MDNCQPKATVLIIPGLRDHVAEHWQTILAERLDKVRTVPPLEADKLNCAKRVAQIQATIKQIEGDVILVAHSAGVLMTVHWAALHCNKRHANSTEQNTDHRNRVVGALLVTPPNLNQPWPSNYPSPEALSAEGWSPLPNQALPFPSIVVASQNDHLASFTAVQQMANAWHSELYDAGAVGHLNPAAGYGEWADAMPLILQLDAVQDTQLLPM